ncbi:uncharacterized protein LOC131702119 [Acipenser ruthenus]|uniref:uncharacterized protein LOC131702119 n=1 Tax=Acipenser ruthenus TaxID=7906 RepID=UPI002740E2D6|nr:uncharacterized protein LOC131702119 [Acipenser ruthenus]
MDREGVYSGSLATSASWSTQSPSLSSLVLSDLDQGFVQLQDHSASASSTLDLQLSSRGSKASRSEIVNEFTERLGEAEGGAWSLSSLCQSPNILLLPSHRLHNLSLLALEHDHKFVGPHSLDSKASTPCQGEHPQSSSTESSADLSCVDLSALPLASQPLWEVSLIQHSQDPCSPLESTQHEMPEILGDAPENASWSPGVKTTPSSFAESLSLHWAGMKHQVNDGGLRFSYENQQSWKEMMALGCHIRPFTFSQASPLPAGLYPCSERNASGLSK